MLLGLLIRDFTGDAHELMTSMLNSAGHMLCDDVIEYSNQPKTLAPDELLYGYNSLHRMYECNDEWIYLAAPTEKDWENLIRVFKSLKGDPRFATGAMRAKNASELSAELTRLFAGNSSSYWEEQLLGADVGAITIDRRRPEAVFMADDFGGQAGWVAPIEHPTFGECVRLTPHVELSRSGGVAKPGQLLGQSTDSVLSEMGYSRDALVAMREKGVII
jgi:crotonobetainyl-CoA:carnitine CoA-transferase CaiB-like acyl-CoA transferase